MNEDLIKFDLENFTEEEFCSKYSIEEKILERIWRSIHQVRGDYGSHKYDEYTKLVINYIKDLKNDRI